MWISRFDAPYVRRGVVEGRGNRLDDAVGLAEKLVIMHELVEKI
jgi:hypothetical protein